MIKRGSSPCLTLTLATSCTVPSAQRPVSDNRFAIESDLWPYIGGIARQNRMKALAIGGTFDHLHALLSLPSTMSFAKAVQLIREGLRNGCTTGFQSTASSNGRKVTGRSALVPHK
ncbi:MAG: transposase [Pyrinomonadaceae bacterium]|nr:transposase [Pyrinomonadaceae bacterium]